MILPSKARLLYEIRSKGIKDQNVLQALRLVPREIFVLHQDRSLAYEDYPLEIEEGQTISQPFIVALMLQLLHLKKKFSLLDIGTGSGYAAAVASQIVSNVYGIEIFPLLAKKAKEHFEFLGYRNIEVKIGDGYQGWEDHAPYDAIQIAAAVSSVQDLQELKSELKIGGRLVVPVEMQDSPYQVLMVIEKIGKEKYRETRHDSVRFMPLVHQ